MWGRCKKWGNLKASIYDSCQYNSLWRLHWYLCFPYHWWYVWQLKNSRKLHFWRCSSTQLRTGCQTQARITFIIMKTRIRRISSCVQDSQSKWKTNVIIIFHYCMEKQPQLDQYRKIYSFQEIHKLWTIYSRTERSLLRMLIDNTNHDWEEISYRLLRSRTSWVQKQVWPIISASFGFCFHHCGQFWPD